MNRKKIALLIVLDLGFLAGVGYMLFNRYKFLENENAVAAPVVEPTGNPVLPDKFVQAPVAQAPVVEISTPVPVQPASPPPAVVVQKPAATIPVEKPPLTKKGPKSSRTFVFYDLSAKSVQLVGDFNGWKPQAFRKTGSGRWSISIQVPRGDYSYNYIVDGQTIRDPNQRRTDLKGRSLLTVAF